MLSNFSHYIDTDQPGVLRFFNLDDCERCCTDCEAPNSLQAVFGVTALDAFLFEAKASHVKLANRLSELYHNDLYGGAVCEHCDALLHVLQTKLDEENAAAD